MDHADVREGELSTTEAPYEVSQALTALDCPLCGEPRDHAIVVGRRARFGMRVRNVACGRCGLVYVNPRPTPEAMAEYYATEYRRHYAAVKIRGADNKPVGPGDPGYQEACAETHRQQAELALRLGGLKQGDSVLEVGCNAGQTLHFMRELKGIEPHGIEPGLAQAQKAQNRGIDCFAGVLEDYDPKGRRFQQVQLFHVLEHVHDPLAALLRLREWLVPGGRLIIEVPNVLRPYGALEGNFFQNAHLFSFSANTLSAFVKRAGMGLVRALSVGSVFVVASHDGSKAPSADFADAHLGSPEQDGAWVAARLRSYAELEELRTRIERGGISMDVLKELLVAVQKPAFPEYLVDTVCSLAELFVKAEGARIAWVLARTAAEGPHAPEVREGLQRFAEKLRTHIA